MPVQAPYLLPKHGRQNLTARLSQLHDSSTSTISSNNGVATLIRAIRCAEATSTSRIVRKYPFLVPNATLLTYYYSSSLKYACPHGVFVSLTPGDPTLWSGIIFVRKGPYAPAILRFQISFPPAYPSLPPLVTFSTDIFHPLITPLTTYMYTTDIQNSGTVSATDEERLPPGGFSLRHGFPGWFGRASRRSAGRSPGGNMQTPSRVVSGIDSPGSVVSAISASPTPGQNTGSSDRSIGNDTTTVDFSICDVLRYIRSTFDDDQVLDSVQLEAAGNPGAWHAWRTHRVKLGKLSAAEVKENSNLQGGLTDDVENPHGGPEVNPKSPGNPPAAVATRKPGEWNWDGVWEVRVKKGVDASVADAALFGSSAGDDLIHFLNMDKEQIETIQDNIRRSLEPVEPQRRGIV
ncbi:UBC-like protein [Venustampulla echinocandica]|uniref:UBC-like protein n=1 Tax=Venustampulla echinocandica TaxID=2656787 RepID=A0A370TJW6_9HELO|nr:UBC-like protein [Venustampulla echinocandica]RDL35821.1 UBC-like protein [Venustampulla echinocandica]